MPSLPPIRGKYAVGATDFTIPLHSTTYIGKAKLKHGETAALALEEVAFTAFYPVGTSQDMAPPLDWLVRPVSTMLRGYAHFGGLSRITKWVFWPMMYLYGSRITIPVAHNAPLLAPDLSPWPLVIFSHGLGGTRTSYSQVCARLAASGRVVLAMEHRDGTGPACVWGVGEGERTLLYIQDDDVVWDEEGLGEGGMPLRTDQLEMRRREIYLAHDSFRGLVDPAYKALHSIKPHAAADAAGWSGAVQAGAEVALTGHSFGGATVLSILANPPPEQHARIPTAHALALDPWLEPLAASFPNLDPTPISVPTGPSEPSLLTASTSTAEEATASQAGVDAATVQAHLRPAKGQGQGPVRVLVLNSEGFTLWKDHFARLRAVVDAWEPAGRRVLTLVRAEHISFSDFPLLPLIRRGKAVALMDLTVELSVAFLDGRVDEAVAAMGPRARKMEVEEVGKRKDGRPKRRLVGEVGDVVVH
ncbi:hypothetical protein FIBSPDRAFT_856902 [Athelia psychrophila]|uniref:1-alkyl-2-acetylglycerophosphocholine esterase n=1 Tax=Athelia psychrophila TaxID=1759441 RepID=A0A166N6I2_9AGAM|nr:hypothetical protein FIBSPDRAFT_856902 [Fibularhizoctonia sp. CBS 109695]